MKKPQLILCLVFAITGILSFENSAIAVLNVSGNVVQDSNSGLEWLVMSQTVNKSPDRIMAGDYGLKAAGWALATVAQIETLLINAGFQQPYNSDINFDSANHLMALLGSTGEYNDDYGHQLDILAFSATPGTSAHRLYSPAIIVGLYQSRVLGIADFPGPSNPSDLENPTIGNWLVRANPSIKPPSFGSNSATLTNNYVPFKVGDKITYKTYGMPFIIYCYGEAIRKETIDQVSCLKLKDSSSNSSTAIAYYWVAQDTSGNVWILKYHDVELNDLRNYGRNYAKIFMPSVVNVGSVLWNSDAIETVVAAGITVPILNTGLGPYHNCIKTKIINTDGDIDYQYYAPGVGPVKEEWNDDGGTNGVEISAITHRSKSVPWLPLLLDD
jgi:hypothetical protein